VDVAAEAAAEAVASVAATAATEPNRDAWRVADDGRMGPPIRPSCFLVERSGADRAHARGRTVSAEGELSRRAPLHFAIRESTVRYRTVASGRRGR
jgi:hypothetical protein